MRVSEDIRKSVVYLGNKTGGEFDPVGTGFLVNMGAGAHYLVTAAHVAIDLDDQEFEIRLNERNGKPGRVHRIWSNWFYHPTDDTVDVAVMPFHPPEWADASWVPFRSFLSEFKLGSKDTGPGDLAYVVGILHFMHGKTRNMPAVHMGHIVLMPDGEKIPVTNWRSKKAKKMEIDAYLVHANALPGSSGSPVFIRRSLQTRMTLPKIQDSPLNVAVPGSVWLLGVWRSAWFGRASDGLSLPKEERRNTVPLGLGTVVPAIKIVEIFNRPELVEMRSKKGAG